jgi:hypothetical protein
MSLDTSYFTFTVTKNIYYLAMFFARFCIRAIVGVYLGSEFVIRLTRVQRSTFNRRIRAYKKLTLPPPPPLNSTPNISVSIDDYYACSKTTTDLGKAIHFLKIGYRSCWRPIQSR